MNTNHITTQKPIFDIRAIVTLGIIFLLPWCSFNVFSTSAPQSPSSTDIPYSLWPDSINVDGATHMLPEPSIVTGTEISVDGDTVTPLASDTLLITAPLTPAMEARAESAAALANDELVYTFNPDPGRAVWLSALFPGLGQLYNRRYWKLPIVIGGFMGLGYATSWNNGMLRDYSRAYADVMDSDPATNSYMDFFPSTTKEEDLNQTWLQNVLKSRKDYYRRNRDLCIICIVGVYLLAMVDAYVDASLSHFDISPALSMDMGPALIPEERGKLPGVGLQWAFNF